MSKGYDITKSKAWNNRKLNPHLFVVGGFQPKISQQKAERALDGKPPGQQTRGGGVDSGAPVVRVSVTNYRRKKLDDDNLIAGYKHLRDSIARSLCVDDGSSLIEWEYGQQVTRGEVGTVVRIELIDGVKVNVSETRMGHNL